MVSELGTEATTELPLLETTSLENVQEDMKSSNALKSTLREVLNWTPNLTQVVGVCCVLCYNHVTILWVIQVITSECAESAIMKLTPGGEDSLVQNVVTDLQGTGKCIHVPAAHSPQHPLHLAPSFSPQCSPQRSGEALHYIERVITSLLVMFPSDHISSRGEGCHEI